jgi:hypothetical protein
MQCARAMLPSMAFPAIDIFSHYHIIGTFLENPVIELKIRFLPTNSARNISHSKRFDRETCVGFFVHIYKKILYMNSNIYIVYILNMKLYKGFLIIFPSFLLRMRNVSDSL